MLCRCRLRYCRRCRQHRPCLLRGCGYRCLLRPFPFLACDFSVLAPAAGKPLRLGEAKGGGLQPAEGEIEAVVGHPGKRKHETLIVAGRSETVDDRASGVAESQQLGDLVIGFPRGVVSRFRQEPVSPFFGKKVQGGVPS